MSKLEDNVNEILGIEKKSEVAIKDFEQPSPVPRVIDKSKTDTITCENCGNASFIQAFFLKKVSALVSPTGKEAVIPIQVFSCGNCGTIPQNMIDQIGEQ